MTKFFLVLSWIFLLDNDSNEDLASTYISAYKEVAISEMHRTGIPASIKLAQGLLESNWGRSDLARTANNHFGIKCGSQWNGGTFYKEDDDKDDRGNLIKSCFRSFSFPTESYMAHSDFLTDERKSYRYGFLFEYDRTDYRSWAHGLKKSGYATDPKYPQKLIDIIERYGLNEFDIAQTYLASNRSSQNKSNIKSKLKDPIKVGDETTNSTFKKKKSKKSRTRVFANQDKKSAKSRMPDSYISRLTYNIDAVNKCRLVRAKGGETIEQISKKVGISTDDLLIFNEVFEYSESILDKEEVVFLEKKKRGYKEQDFHIVQEGETMKDISQKYAIRLNSLYLKNRMPKGSETLAGQKIYLSKTASLNERPRFILKDSKRKHNFLFDEESK